MSRIGKLAVAVPSGVDVTVDGQSVSAKGKLGTLGVTIVDDIAVAMEDGTVKVKPRTNSRFARNMWATARAQVFNIVQGVSEGFKKDLEINGVGYRAQVQGKDLVLTLGYSHEVRYAIPEGIDIKCEKPTAIAISGADKQQVGQVAAVIRDFRGPEPFKGKGIKYAGETIVRKEGKKK